MKYIFLAIINLLVLSSCDSGEAGPIVSREKLQVEFDLDGANESNPNGDGSGRVQITAFEENAVRYAFKIDTGDQIESQSGILEYTFLDEGLNTYTIVVWAYAESGQFVNKTFTLEVLKSNDAPGTEFSTLVFSDEFEYEGELDDSKWFHQVIAPNNGSWFNGEVQHYTDRTENSIVSDGTLKIKAIKENYTFQGSTKSYTSARLNSKFAFQYGKVEVRAKLPAEAGTWPAIWTLGVMLTRQETILEINMGMLVGLPAEK